MQKIQIEVPIDGIVDLLIADEEVYIIPTSVYYLYECIMGDILCLKLKLDGTFCSEYPCTSKTPERSKIFLDANIVAAGGKTYCISSGFFHILESEFDNFCEMEKRFSNDYDPSLYARKYAPRDAVSKCVVKRVELAHRGRVGLFV